jgi:hypothetical protein
VSEPQSYEEWKASLAAAAPTAAPAAGPSAYDAWKAKLTNALVETKHSVEGNAVRKPAQGPTRQVTFIPDDQQALLSQVDPDATPPWGASFLAGLKASPTGKMNFLREKFGSENVKEVKDSSGNIVNVVIGRPGQRPMLLDPKGIDFGDILAQSGNVLETAAGMGGAVLAARAGRGRMGSAAIEAGADLAGGVARQAVSAMLPGDDNLSMADRAGMVGLGVAAGQVANVAQGSAALVGREAPLPKAIGGKGVMPATRAQSDLKRAFAEEGDKESLQSISGETVKDRADRAAGIQGRVNETLRESGEDGDFRLTGAQATGSRAAAKAWHVLSQTPEAGDEILRMERRQLSQLGQAAEAWTKKMAADPKALGNEAVGDKAVEVLGRHIGELRAARSEAARPLFEAAQEASRGMKIVPTEKTITTLQHLLKESEFLPASQTKPLREALEALQAGSSGKGRIGIDQVQNLMKTWGDLAHGEGTIIEGATKANQRRMAGLVLRGIEADLDAASHGAVNAAAIDALTAARTVWREHSKGIDAVSTGAVNRLLKLEGEPTTEKVVDRLLSMGEAETGHVMRLIEKTDPATAQNIRAQGILNILEKSGHGVATPGGAVMDSVSLSPQQLVALGRKHGKQINALLGGDKKAQAMVKDIFEAADMLATGPAYRGAQTQPNEWTMSVMQKAMAGAPRHLVAELQGAVTNAVQRQVFSPKTMMTMLMLPEGAEAFHKLVRLGVAPTPKADAAASMARESIRALTQLSLLAGRNELFDGEPEKTKPSPNEYAGTQQP